MDLADSHPQGFARARRAFDLAAIALFLGALAAPTIDACLRPIEQRSPARREFRAPRAFPGAPDTLVEVRRFPPEFEAWFDDALGLRDHLLRARGRVLALGLGVSPTPMADLAADGWMFYRGGRSREAWAGEIETDDAILARWQAELGTRRDSCRALGAQHLFVIGPNKETLYPERVPGTWHKLGATPFERLRGWLRERDEQQLLDLVPSLQAARAQDSPQEREFLYSPLGTHWTARGNYVCYARIIEAVRERFPQIPPPLRYDELIRAPFDGAGDSWAYRCYLEDVLWQPVYATIPRVMPHYPAGKYGAGLSRIVALGPDANLPRAMLFHDSFGQVVHTLLALHFSRLDCVWSPDLDLELVRRQKPDIVIELFVERLLANFQPERMHADLTTLSRDPWEEAKQVLFVLTRENAESDLELSGDVTRRQLPDLGGLLRLRLERDGGYLVLPPLPDTDASELLVRMEIIAPGETEVAFMPVSRGEDEPARRQPRVAHLNQGLNDVLVRLPRIDVLERIAVRPGRIPGRYVICQLEVRAAPAE